MLRNLVPWLFCLITHIGFSQHKTGLHPKLSPYLQQVTSQMRAEDSVDVSISSTGKLLLHPRISLYQTDSFFIYSGKISRSELFSLESTKEVVFINARHPPKEEVNTGASDPTLNLVTYAHNRFPQVRGDSISAAVKERRFDTTDIDLKGRIIATGLENASVTTHASLMATIMAGAGNSSPFALGAAPAATVGSTSFTLLVPDPEAVLRGKNISIQNHSYGTIVENFYGNEAVAYDADAVRNPELLHVFSAGNSGTATDTLGYYGKVTAVANLSGNFKQAKNILTVSAVDSSGNVLPLSSKGPAYDGRIKPELVAYGEDGSSGAAAITSGVAILVQDLYRQLHFGTLPSSALVKAVLLNSAHDVGENFPDYTAGYGLVNAFGALNTIKEGRYLEGSVANSVAKTFSVVLPKNTKTLKATLVWTDPAASPNAPNALVNDLHFSILSPDGTNWLPWVLDPTPDRNRLLQPAQRKTDTLNNSEQISLENPLEGVYTFRITGARLSTPDQPFAIAYELDSAGTFYWTFPTSEDPLVAGRRHRIRWQSNITEPGHVEYATNGTNWRLVGSVSNTSINEVLWWVPDTVTKAQFRLITNSRFFYSDTFTISPQLSLQTGFNCADSVLLLWKTLPVPGYQVYTLGAKYLQPVKTLTDTAFLFSKNQYPSPFYSIAPILNGQEAIRSNATNYAAQGVGCYLRSFYVQTQTANSASFLAELGTLYRVKEVALEKKTGTIFTLVQTIVAPTTTTFVFPNNALLPGENRFRFRVTLLNGSSIYSNTETVFATGGANPVYIYPNPVAQNGVLTILTNEVGRYTLLVFDIAGKQIYQTKLNRSVTTLPVQMLGKGIAIVQIVDKEGTIQTHKQFIF